MKIDTPLTLYAVLLSGVLALTSMPVNATSNDDNDDDDNYCTQTANLVYRACGFEVLDNYSLEQAKCLNESDPKDRRDCYDEARTARNDTAKLCRAQRAARLGICVAVGEKRYDPDFDQQNFQVNFRSIAKPNRYFPLAIGSKWEFGGKGEQVKLEILDRTKQIDGVTCVVLRDQVFVDGQLVEDTDDWFALDRDANAWYCGEEVKDYETFADDRPATPELVAIDGSFKVARDGAKAGIIFLAQPKLGETYREEFSIANAEDVSSVMSTNYRYGADSELDRFVPAALARQLCNGDCVVLNAFTAASPGKVERKYYAPGIGFFLQVVPATGETIQVVSCNVDPRCAALPRL